MNKHKHHHEPEHGKPPAEAEDATPQAAPETARPQTVDMGKAPAGDDVVQRLRAELNAAKDRELRVHAELENVRKRAARELDERLRYANLSLIRELLPVIDNIERAIEAAEKNADAAALLEGFKMVDQQLGEVLKSHHCKRIEALHTPFDPNVHHAVLQQPSEEHPANTVLMVTQNGYQLHDRVVRPSQVIVSTTK